MCRICDPCNEGKVIATTRYIVTPLVFSRAQLKTCGITTYHVAALTFPILRGAGIIPSVIQKPVSPKKRQTRILKCD